MAPSITTNASPTTVKPGKSTSFPQSVKLKKGEVVVFSWITYKSRKQRDAIMKKVMKDPTSRRHDEGPEENAVRRQAHVLGRLQEFRRSVDRRFVTGRHDCNLRPARACGAAERSLASRNMADRGEPT